MKNSEFNEISLLIIYDFIIIYNLTVKLMSKTLLNQKIKSYNLIRQLGKGSFSMVYQGVNDKNQNFVAIKATKLSKLNKSPKLKELIKTEINVLKQCNNDNVIKYLDSFYSNEYLFIVTEYCNEGDLETYLANKKRLTEAEALGCMREILNGFRGLHEVKAMHRDFKVSNVLLHNGVCKIADLGFAKQMQEKANAQTILGTSVTMAPQILQEKPYGFQADIWSLGVVFYQLLYGQLPFYGANDFQQLKKIKNTRPYYFGVNISNQTRDFIDRCLTVNPKKRITWKQIYEHPLFTTDNSINLTYGKIRCQMEIDRNKKFYEDNEFPDLPEFSVLQNRIQQAKLVKMQVITENQIRKAQNLQLLQLQARKKAQKQSTFQKLQNLYLGRISDLLITQKFIQPYIKKIQYTRINNATALFILNKKSYMQMLKLYDIMLGNKNIFNVENHFQQYTKSKEYKEIIAQIKMDINTLKTLCNGHKQNIKYSTLQIQSQLNLANTKNLSYDSLMNDIIKSYIKILAENLDCVKAEHKTDILKVLQALMYLKNNPKPYSHEFERIVMAADLAQSQRKLRIKYPSKLMHSDSKSSFSSSSTASFKTAVF